ncbi:MAG TPA: hypothetical protein VMV23_09400 [Candidatus Nanopelagicaceae bacterium]|nr:hypothetical protein [Candidatus Nanopelagicaceae bacterium]
MLLIPAGQTDISRLKLLRDVTLNQLKSAVRGTTTTQPLIYRDLIQQDLLPNAAGGDLNTRFSNPNALVANVSGQLYSQTLQNFQSIGIYGYASLAASPLISLLQFNLGSAVTIAQFFLDTIYADQSEVVGYFDTPVIYTPQQTVNINAVASAAVGVGAESFVLLGMVYEPAGRTIQPQNVQ